jgi:hypothetical protein
MNEALLEREQAEHEPFKPELWIDYQNENVGTATAFIDLDGQGVDIAYKHASWPTPQGINRISQNEGDPGISHALSSYGFAAYQEFKKLDSETDMYLDDRAFMSGTDLIEVLAEATACAVDDEREDLSSKLLEKTFEYAVQTNFGCEKMKDYSDFALNSGDIGVVQLYVRFMNQRLNKHLEEPKEFMHKMAHTILDLPEKSFENQRGIEAIDKQILLEEIGMAWIRRGMPVAEIDWLP